MTLHCVLKLETVAAAVPPSDTRMPHYNFAVCWILWVGVFDRNGIPNLQIRKDDGA